MLSMWHLTGLNSDITHGYAAWSRIFVGIGLPFLFLPVTTASYDSVPPDKTNQASALISVARNTGGSMGVALAQNVLACRNRRRDCEMSLPTFRAMDACLRDRRLA